MCQKIEIRSSKMKKFCETASIFEIANVKNEEILRDFLQNLKLTTSKRSKSARLQDFLGKL